MGTLASVLEAAGLATVALSSIRGQVVTTRPPRALHCEFPLGRPLGRPEDPALQRRVLDAAFALLDEPAGPVLVDFPEVITDEADAPLSCAIPPADPGDVHPAEAEARGLLPAWRRSNERFGRTTVGKVVDADGVPAIVGLFARIADGEGWKDVGLPGDPTKLAADIRNFYEEAALSLTDAVPGARQAESWYVTRTKAGDAVQRARVAMKDAGAGHYFWNYLLPMTQHRVPDAT
ncbi:MAG: hypothetical protein HOH21_04300 [Acidimicrobiaceae bacterium]|nr:hypothetical protein [Acidimicrobiaceae bacterium]MDE0893791.1 hypothetical protein [Acidimicrobiales bacterium]